ncbi:class I SAM-dependent methyltransferase [Streptomyces sp. NPDC059009]|uniref:class I SAM-dependent methyltransferase n=1 Tax=Streptomyces sp. NPDC059009 TaxID=3346694 RepID=UPI0036BE8832
MVAGWEWDESLFAGTAAYYRRGRLPYAPGLAEVLAGVLGLDGRGRLLDVGCGPGTVGLTLVDRFGEVVGVDPDAGMIEEAVRAAAAQGVAGKTRWVRARAEELPSGLGEFTVATLAQSFHWMDRALVAATVRDMLRPGGALVHISDAKEDPPAAGGALPWPVVPYEAVQELVVRHLGPVRRAGRGVLPQGTPGGEEEYYARARFAGPERHVVPGGEELVRTADDVVAWVFSLSSAAPHLFGAGLPAFESELRHLLSDASPAGRFSERGPGTEVVVWRKAP